MGSEPVTWHYGVVARWWAEFNTSGPEIAYFQRFIEDGGEPALDVACGTGRLLIPYLRAGLDVDGCDVSPDMLALCRERAEAEGLEPTLYPQAMHELELPRRYRTIVVCGGFGLGGNRAHDVQALDRLYEHLEPGGLLLVDNEAPYADKGLWTSFLTDERKKLPQPSEPPDRRRPASDGVELGLRSRIVAVDPLAQCVTMEMRGEMWREGELVADERHMLKITLYMTHELRLLLERAGFVDVTVQGSYAEREATGDDDFVVFLARKPGG